MSCVCRLYAAIGTHPNDGMYLRSYSPEARDGIGDIRVTPDRALALRFADAGAAMTLWRTVPKCRPRRDDGKPNRPLTAFHMEIENEEATK